MPITTQHLSAADPDDIARAAALLREGHLVAFATETVYGLGANALDPDAVASIFNAKQRPSWDPLIVHLASTGQLTGITAIPPHLAARIAALASAFWPGPLTLLLPRNAAIPDAVTAARPLVGVRIPAHPAAQALLTAVALPIAAPSANLFGHTSPTTAEHVLADLDGRIHAVLDAGPTTLGLESTVLDPTQTPMVLYRPGAITPAQLTAATGIPVHVYQPEPNPATDPAVPQSLPAPGVGLRHYAPHAQLILVDPSPSNLPQSLLTHAERALASGQIPGLMLPDGWAAPPATLSYPWGPWHDLDTLATRLFAGLRHLDVSRLDVSRLDGREVTTILCPLPPPGGLADAIRDRLQKASIPA